LNDVRARFGAALREIRTRQQLTQEQLAERSGLSYKFIGEVERGRGNPTLDTIARLADALGVNITDLLQALPQAAGHAGEYRISRRDLQMLREAAASIGAWTEQVVSPQYPRLRRKHQKRLTDRS
jgi:transcriptional regulator with XRE-family HTH domain